MVYLKCFIISVNSQQLETFFFVGPRPISEFLICIMAGCSFGRDKTMDLRHAVSNIIVTLNLKCVTVGLRNKNFISRNKNFGAFKCANETTPRIY